MRDHGSPYPARRANANLPLASVFAEQCCAACGVEVSGSSSGATTHRCAADAHELSRVTCAVCATRGHAWCTANVAHYEAAVAAAAAPAAVAEKQRRLPWDAALSPAANAFLDVSRAAGTLELRGSWAGNGGGGSKSHAAAAATSTPPPSRFGHYPLEGDCFNCGAKGHCGSSCPQPRSLAHAAGADAGGRPGAYGASGRRASAPALTFSNFGAAARSAQSHASVANGGANGRHGGRIGGAGGGGTPARFEPLHQQRPQEKEVRLEGPQDVARRAQAQTAAPVVRHRHRFNPDAPTFHSAEARRAAARSYNANDEDVDDDAEAVAHHLRWAEHDDHARRDQKTDVELKSRRRSGGTVVLSTTRETAGASGRQGSDEHETTPRALHKTQSPILQKQQKQPHQPQSALRAAPPPPLPPAQQQKQQQQQRPNPQPVATSAPAAASGTKGFTFKGECRLCGVVGHRAALCASSNSTSPAVTGPVSDASHHEHRSPPGSGQRVSAPARSRKRDRDNTGVGDEDASETPHPERPPLQVARQWWSANPRAAAEREIIYSDTSLTAPAKRDLVQQLKKREKKARRANSGGSAAER